MSKLITSPSNPVIKTIRKLRNRKERDATGMFYVEGIRAVGEAIRTGQLIEHILYCPDLLDSTFGNQLVDQLPRDFPGLIELTPEVFNSFSLKEGPQGLAAVVKQRWHSLLDVEKSKGLWTGLDSIQDPGNLGAILRSIDAVGGTGLILLDNSTDPFHPSSIRASTGAIFTQKVVKTDLNEFKKWKEAAGFPMVGTFCGDAIPYRDYNYPKDMILLMGSEQKGLQPEHLALCDAVVTIPLVGNVDSLNVSVAASIVMFEIFHQKGNPG